MLRRNLLIGLGALATPALAQPARVLRFVPQSNLAVLDPIWTTSSVTLNHAYYVFDTLYAADSGLRPRPQMAEGAEAGADGLSWRVRLREGLRFHSGEPVRAVDCVASLQRWCAREGFGQLLAAAVDRWAVVDDREFVIHLKRPFPSLLSALGKPDSSAPFIMPERLARTDPARAVTEMVGSGPYRFVAADYVSGSRVVYERFDGYVPRQDAPDWASGAKVAHYPRVEWLVIPDAATAFAALTKGEADWWEQPLPDLQPKLASDSAIAMQLADPAGRIGIMRLNHLHPPFNDLTARRAVLLAIDQEEMMRAAVGDDATLWATCRGLFPRHTPYFADLGNEFMPASISAGQAALKASRYAGERVAILEPTDNPVLSGMCQVAADTLRRVGFTVDMQAGDYGTFIQRRSSREPVEKGGWSIFVTTGAAVGQATPAVSPLMRGQGRAGWFGWWTSADAEALTQGWLDAADEPARAAIAGQLNRLGMDQVASIPLGQVYARTAYRRAITGIQPGLAPYPWGVRPA